MGFGGQVFWHVEGDLGGNGLSLVSEYSSEFVSIRKGADLHLCFSLSFFCASIC